MDTKPSKCDIKKIFAEALLVTDLDKRELFLQDACAADQALRTKVDKLLRAHDKATAFMETPVFVDEIALDSPHPSEGPGTLIGPYKLLEKIGEGGMAVVYMAEQERPLQRKVALKLVKLGMESAQVVARFEAERQALALMDHPHIARVFDAGTTDSGRPYFVMELVKGVSITQFCDKNKLSTQERLALFVSVCQAVQHAHQKGIIHRDLKPSNIMVTLHDGKPVPRVIDFGIAKATNRRLTEKTLFTHYGQIIGTPEYMSPEQAELSDLDVDTRTDVYSLGVLLYELLTGRPPFDADYLRGKSYAEIQRIIREEEPTKPSTKISTLGEALIEIADRRQTSPETLRRQIRTDLDWVAMKTLEKDRTRRYASVSELAADIERHLCHEPVLAGPPSTWHRMKKYVQRHRAMMTTVMAVGITLLIGLGVSGYLLMRVQEGDADRHFNAAWRLHTQGSYKDAKIELDSQIEEGTVNDKTRLLYAQILFDLDRQDDAEAHLNRLLVSEPEIAGTAHYLLSRIKHNTDPAQAQVHREQADRLRPATADAYASRARAADTPDKALQWLDQALQLDPSHYAARESRALLCYDLHYFIEMGKEAGVIIALRRENYLGYALRALAQRELGELEMALADHNRAIELCDIERELPILLDHRQETYWRLGDYQAALRDARECVALAPQKSRYRATLVKIMYILGLYDEAEETYDSFPSRGGTRHWLAAMSQYISDTVSAGESPQIPDDILQTWSSVWVPPGLMIPTLVDLFETLQSRATRLVRGAVDTSSWSPDGRQIAYTRSDSSRWDRKTLKSAGSLASFAQNGIEIRDLESGQTRVLVTQGGSPVWSPDGRFIAYLRAADLYYRTNEEVWLCPVQGGQPRRLASGNSPCWTSDHPTRLYYRSLSDEMLCYIDVDDPNAAPVPVTPCRGLRVQVSPNGRYLASVTWGKLVVSDLTSGEDIVEWIIPGAGGYDVLRWSPNSEEISFGRGWIQVWPAGLWIFNMERMQGRHILDPMALSCNWSPDRSHVALDLSYPVNEIWLAEVDPNRPTWEALGTGQTRGEYLQHYLDRHMDPNFPKEKRKSVLELRMMENLCAVGFNQYEWGEYQDALWTLQQLAHQEPTKGSDLDFRNTAYLGMTLAKLGRSEQARQSLERLRLLCTQGDIVDETSFYQAEKAIARSDSALVGVWDFIQAGNLDEALDVLEKMDSIPDHGGAIQSASAALARAYWRSGVTAKHQDRGSGREAACYESALRADPNYMPALRDLAWQLATSEESDLRDGTRARNLAQRACGLSDYRESSCLASLAAAFAESGDFSDAVKWQREALEHLPEGWSNHELVARLEYYNSNRHPHVERVEPLVAWWPFTAGDGTKGLVQDASGHGLSGKLIGDAKVVNDPDRGPVLSLDGLEDWLECAHDARFNCVDEITISLWIKVSTFDKAHQAVITKGEHAWEFLRRPMGKMVGFHCQGPEVRRGQLGLLVGKSDVDDDQWHHLAGVYNGISIFQYVDGRLDASNPARGTINLDDGPVYVGRSSFFTTCDWNGWIDDVRIYNHALSQGDIKALSLGQTVPRNPDRSD